MINFVAYYMELCLRIDNCDERPFEHRYRVNPLILYIYGLRNGPLSPGLFAGYGHIIHH